MHHSSELTVVLIMTVALAAGAATRLFSRRTRFPYTIAMMLLGIVVGIALKAIEAEESLLALARQGAEISPHLIIFVFLPALVFESAFAMDVYAFRKNMGAILLLAVPALVAATFATASLMVWLTSYDVLGGWQWPWIPALVFGALASATDPVAVVAILRELGAPKRLGILIEGESLLNDGTSIVIFTVLFSLMVGGAGVMVSPAGIALDFVRIVAGGLVVGLALALVVSAWLSRTFNDPLVEITLTVILAYASMILAEGLFHVSGVIAIVAAGLLMSARGRVLISPEVEHFLHQFWEMLAYIANTLIFFLVGLVMETQIRSARTGELLLIVGMFAGVMAIRAIVTFAFSPAMRFVGDPVTAKEATVMSWSGLRGAVSLALALVVVQHPDVDPDLGRQILFITAGLVLMTILVNGSTMGALLRRLGLDKAPAGERQAQLSALATVIHEVEERIEALKGSKDLRTVSWTEVEDELASRRSLLTEEIRRTERELESSPPDERVAGYWHQALETERQAYWSLYSQGTLGATAASILNHEIDMQLDEVAHGRTLPPSTRIPPSLLRSSRRYRRLRIGSTVGFARMSRLYDLSRAEIAGAEAVLSEIGKLSDSERKARERIVDTYRAYQRRGKERLEDFRANLPEIARAVETRLARRIQLNFERDGYEELAHRGVLDGATAAGAISSVDERMKKLLHGTTAIALPPIGELCRSTPLFESLPENDVAEISRLAKEHVLAPGETLFSEHDKGDSMYIIARGGVHVIKRIDGEDVILDVLGGGDILGEMALLTGDRRTATARACTAVTLGRIDRVDFDHLISTRPKLHDLVWRAFAERKLDDYVIERRVLPRLSKSERQAWIASGTLTAFHVRESVPVGDASYIFLVTGGMNIPGTEVRAPALVQVTPDVAVTAAENSRIMLLPSPASVDATLA
jgi:Na+/H+ antiporter